MSQKIIYQHKQRGYLSIVLLFLAIILTSLFLIREPNSISILVLITLIFCLFQFYSLTVIVDKDFIHIKFGIGIFIKKIKIIDIKSAKVTSNPCYFGWGIRYIFPGWLFNVSGFKSVQVNTKNTRYRIGTNKPIELNQIINKLI